MQSLNIFDQLAQGGLGIWFIGALSVLALAVTLERLVRFRAAKLAPAGLVDEVLALWQRGEFADIEARLASRPSALSARAGDIASLALREQQQRAYPLAVVATVAPIVGLLGTVVGMIKSFHVIAFAGGLGDGCASR